MRLLIEKTRFYTYPDVMVVCEKPDIKKYRGLDSIKNPALIVEVLSPSIEGYDKGAKFDNYRSLESLREYVLVSLDAKKMMPYTKQTDGSWNLMDFIGDKTEIELSSIECPLNMKDIYNKVDFEA